MPDNDALTARIIRLYSPGTLIGPPRTRSLPGIYREYGLDPRTTHPRLFEAESISHMRQELLVALFDAMRVRREHRVLSLGEGNGAVSRVLVKSVGCRVTGVDLNGALLASARSLARFAALPPTMSGSRAAPTSRGSTSGLLGLAVDGVLLMTPHAAIQRLAGDVDGSEL